MAIGLLAVIAFVAALYLARAFFVPLLIGILASYALSPVVEWLKRCYIPRAAGAALVLVVLVAGTVGFVFMPWLQSRFAGVNSAVLFISLLFFGWLCGVWGLLLGAPLVAIAKVICERVDSLKPIGALLGR